MILWDRPAHRCALYSVASSRDGGGGTTLTYTLEQSAIPCSVNTSGANETDLFGQTNQAVTHTVGIRSDALTVTPAPGWKIVVTDLSVSLHVEGIRRGRTPPSGLLLLPAMYYFSCRELLL
jgi:hypothetical protein